MYVNVYCKALYINNIHKKISFNNGMKSVYYYVGVLEIFKLNDNRFVTFDLSRKKL